MFWRIHKIVIMIGSASLLRMGKRMVEENCATALLAEMIVLRFKRNDHFFDERKIAQPYPKEDMITLRVTVPMAVLSLSRIAVFRNSEEVVKSVSSVFQ